MTISHPLALAVPTLATDKLSPFRFGTFQDGILLTNDQGKWHWLSQESFEKFITGHLDPEVEDYKELETKGFVRPALQLDQYSTTIRQRKEFLGAGPTVHQIWLDDQHGQLKIETAKAIVDHLMHSTTRELEIELIQQNKAIDHELFAFLLSYVQEKNRYESKKLHWTLRSTLSNIDEKVAVLLRDNQFTIHVALQSSTLVGTSASQSHKQMKENLQRLQNLAISNQKSSFFIKADCQIHKEHATDVDELLQILTEIGVRCVYINPQLYGDGALSNNDLAKLFRALLQQLLSGQYDNIVEGHTQSLLASIMRHNSQASVGYRSPNGAGLSIHSYDTAGRIFPNMQAAKLGDSMFLLGQVGETTYQEVMQHSTVKTLTVASLVECLPGLSEHWSAPFLSVDPISTYLHTGDLFEKMPTSPRVQSSLTRLEIIFEVLLQPDSDLHTKLTQWLDTNKS